MQDYVVPFWRRRVFWLTVILLALTGFTAASIWRRTVPDRKLREAALLFLAAADRGEDTACRALTAMEPERLKFFLDNRRQLGELKSRQLYRQEPLRFGERTGYLYCFNSIFGETPLREIIAVLQEPGQVIDVFSVRFQYPRLPRPEPKEHYRGAEATEIRRKAESCFQAFDRNDWPYFNAIARYEYGSPRGNNYRPLENFRKRFGPLVNRTPWQEIRLQDGLAGCPNLKIVRVKNQTSYKIKNTLFLGDEFIYLVRDDAAADPAWEVYAFDPGRPQKFSVIKPAPRPPAAGKTADGNAGKGKNDAKQ